MRCAKRVLVVCLCACICLLAQQGVGYAASSAAKTQQAAGSQQGKSGVKPAQSSPKKSGIDSEQARSVPTRILADSMTYDAEHLLVTFNSNVYVERPDFEMWANRINVYLKPEKKTAETEKKDENASMPGLAAGEVERIVATGNVRMKREENSSTSQKATYTVDTEVLVLEGDPVLSDGDNTIAGEVVTYYMKENRSEVTGGAKKRVEAVFSTSGKPTREGGR